MKKIYLLLVVILLAIPAFSQPRVDGMQQFKVLKSSPIVTNIVGWAYDTQKKNGIIV